MADNAKRVNDVAVQPDGTIVAPISGGGTARLQLFVGAGPLQQLTGHTQDTLARQFRDELGLPEPTGPRDFEWYPRGLSLYTPPPDLTVNGPFPMQYGQRGAAGPKVTRFGS